MRWWCLMLLLASCSAHRSSGGGAPDEANARDLRARIHEARGEAATESRRWSVAAASFALARASRDSLAAQWGQGQAVDRASTLRWSKRIQGSVLALAFTPDGRVLASGHYDSVVRLWDVERGELLAELKGHTAEVHAVAFSPDGRWLASAGRPGELRVWDWRQGQPRAVIPGHTDVVLGLAFSPDGRRLASGGLDKAVRVWDFETGAEQLRFEHDDNVIAVAFSPDGGRLLSTSADRSARVWDLESRKELHRLVGHEEKVESGAFSADGQRIMTAAGDRAVRFWDARSGQLTDVFRNSGDVSVAAIDGGFQLLVQGGWDGRVQLVDGHGGALLERMDAHQAFVMSVSMSPDGRTFASGGMDGLLAVWRRPEVPAQVLLRGPGVWVEALAFSQDRELMTGSEDGWRRWRIAEERELRPEGGGAEAAVSLAVSPDRERIAVGTLKGRALVLDARSGRVLLELPGGSGSVRAVAFSPDGALLAVAGDPDIQLWSVADSRPVGLLQGHTGKVWALAFDSTGRRLASGSTDKTVRTWDVERRQPLLRLDMGEPVRAVVFTPSEPHLVTAGMRQPLRIWDVTEGRLLKTLGEKTVGVLALAVSPDGRFLASSGMAAGVKVWGLPSGEQLGTLAGQQGFLAALAFSPDGALLVSAASDQTLQLNRFDSVAHPPPAGAGLDGLLRRYGLVWDEARFRFTPAAGSD
ncbi:WD domain-/G-beta repeat-containing protein [Corallococcus coralloides]|uniref:WD domain-/G-beta repeat-containing protein n=1 Tax=Corallococcus coralloides TaxID=184914 RepID=A0A410RMY8_CORCK|nr:WD40 repeat domain-containing protein [Corallococcus coralloides]QAT83272.1 WD domain-/G-beta repeat-containing protein [Corallococcus coralloides]